MPKRHYVFEAILHLYPKSFRHQYGNEMIWVVDDLLAEAPNTLQRLLVWLRVGSELPFSILQENSNSIGEKTMNKMAFTKNRKVIGGVILAVILLGLVLSAGWLRGHVLPRVAGLAHRQGVVSTQRKQEQALNGPVGWLGGGGQPKVTYTCRLYAAQKFHSQIGCGATSQSYDLLSHVGDKKAVLDKVAGIEAKLKAEGYVVGTNGVTLTSLVAGTYDGIDYSADAFYQKVIGDIHCVFDTQIAYANPAAPALHTGLDCTKTFNVFGAPSTATYDSRKGFGEN